LIHTNKEIILPGTFELLQQLQADPQLDSFFLVGGTALALHIGHRLSIDLDLFTKQPIDTQNLESYLSKTYNFFTDYVATNTLKGITNNVKTDFITHNYKLVNPLITQESLRLASIEDIGAMKLNAIAHSGNRQKDFFDFYFLLEHFPLSIYLEAFEVKYPNSNPVLALKGLTYFDDIDFEIEKPILTRKITFKQVKARLQKAAKSPFKQF